MRDELVNAEVLNSITEMLKILPTRDFEFSFLADYFMIVNQILISTRKFKNVQNLQLLANRTCDALKYHLIPYLIESGLSNFGDIADDNQFSARIYFMQRFLELLNSLTQTDLYLQQAFRLTSGI